MTIVHNFIVFALCSIIYQGSVSAQTPIWPIPTSCPATSPLTYTVHLQHDTDCTKFYKCDHGKKILFSCPSGLHFHPLFQVCDWPANVGCTHVPTPSPTTPSTTTPTPTTPSVDPGCPFPGPLNYTVHLPHATDCTKFYKCDNGKKVEFDCPSGLHFNPVLEVCDWPAAAGCGTTTPTPKPTPSPTTPSVDPGCPFPGPLNYTVHLPHATDCTKFYKCDNGKKVEFDCPSGLHFNPVLEVCDWPAAAGCGTTTPTPKPTPSPTTPSVDPGCPFPGPLNHTVHLPHATDCTKFYKCDNGKKVEFDCPSGLHFNPVLEVCDWPAAAGCGTTTPTPKPTPSPTTPSVDPGCPFPGPLNYTVHLPHATDCTKFYKCDNGKKVEFDCPSGMHFNPVLEVCDWPGSAGCGTTPPTPRPTPSTTTPASSKCATAPHNYHIPHATDCTKFYKCDHGIPVEFDCPPGLHFNARYQVCDWPASAGC